jgi:hypothetical protein
MGLHGFLQRQNDPEYPLSNFVFYTRVAHIQLLGSTEGLSVTSLHLLLCDSSN